MQGTGFAPDLGIYVALCVDQGAGAAPSPCVGGVDMEGSGSSSAWISSNPPSYASDLAVPFGSGGSFDVQLTVTSADQFVDCFAEGTRCVIATRADHTATSNRSADVRVPVYFSGQTPPDSEPTDPGATISLGSATVRAGAPLTVTGGGFMPGEQVQIWLLSDPVLVAVVAADPDGSVAHAFTVPADLAPGVHHVELRGLTSGLVVRSADLTVLPAAATAGLGGLPGARPGGPVGTPPPGRAALTGAAYSPANLAFTGGTLVPLGGGAVLLVVGAVLLAVNRRTNRRTNRQDVTP